MRTADLDYDLPEELIAQQPVVRRSTSRLLWVRREDGSLQDRSFSDLPDVLKRDTLLVVNNTRVLPARFVLKRRSGGRIEGLWLSSTKDGDWNVLLRGGSRLKPGEPLCFERAPQRYTVTVVSASGSGAYVLHITPDEDCQAVLEQAGTTPLPPYIRRAASAHEDRDRQRYQTIFAKHGGAVAAPTAGLHFDDELVQQLRARGIDTAEVTLHVGAGTFKPISVDRLGEHIMHHEAYHVSAEVWEQIRSARQSGRPVTSVGTTSARVLEAVAATGSLQAATNLFIYPPYEFKMVDALITNFHLPRSTLLAMIYAFGGRELMRRAYAHAIDGEYRFYSYGDAMLIQ